jgi:dolichyl-phosphate beta-glucosyltransferase
MSLLPAAPAAKADVLGCSQSSILRNHTTDLPLRPRYDLKLISLSIVIPAYNEEKRLPGSLDAILEFVGGRYESVEVIVVDDGSRDGTADCVREYAASHHAVRLLQNPGNRGKGYAVRRGMLQAKGEWILSTDADLSSPITEIDRLFSAVSSAGAEVAIGSRALDRSLVGVHQPASREYAGRVFNFVMRLITGLKFQDTQCGFKLYRGALARELYSRCQTDGFLFDLEIILRAKKAGARIAEFPVTWSCDPDSRLRPGRTAIRTIVEMRGIKRSVV